MKATAKAKPQAAANLETNSNAGTSQPQSQPGFVARNYGHVREHVIRNRGIYGVMVGGLIGATAPAAFGTVKTKFQSQPAMQ